MSQIKSFRFPDLDPDEAFRLMKQIIDKLGSQPAQLQAIAATWGMSPKSSGLRLKIADLTQYGLIEGRGMFKATELAQRLVINNDNQAFRDMMNNIQLLNTLYNNLAGQEAPQNITPNVMQITQCDMVEADRNKDKIRNLYNSFLQKIKGMQSPIPSNMGFPPIGNSGKTDTGEPTYKMGDVKIFMPKDERSLKLLKKMIETIEFEITGEESTKKKHSE
jgi:hypothetical protein